jgi:hypothetical protein
VTDHWAICPFLNAPDMTWTAVEDLLAQSLPGVRVLLVDQGASREDREEIDRRIDQRGDRRVLCWHWLPALPSLSGCWNRALQFVWDLGGEEALVVNNDAKFARGTYECLLGVMEREKVLFVSALGVREAQWPTDPPQDDPYMWASAFHDGPMYSKGGPDFSCFLLSKAGHDKYPFDEQFIPAYHEDLDMHRRYMLGGDGDRIFSVNLPFLHYASGTIKDYTPEQRSRFNAGFMRCKAYYTRKWGPPNEEIFHVPFGKNIEGEDYDRGLWNLPVTTPELQRWWQVGRRPSDAPPRVELTPTLKDVEEDF